MLLKTCLTFFTFLFAVGAFAQPSFEKLFESFINKGNYQTSTIGAKVFNLDEGKVIFNYNHKISMAPGSLLKLVTSGAALEILGKDYKFQTKIYHTGNIDKEGTINGNLIIKGGGDPTLGSKYFEPHFLSKWCNSISSKGIKRIKGNIVMDISAYEDQTVPDTWIWEDIGNYYGAGAGAFAVYDNTIKISLKSGPTGSLTSIIKTEPSIDGLNFENHVLSSNRNSDQAYVYGAPWEGKKVIRGTIPKNREKFTIKAALPNPALVLGNALKTELVKLGTKVDGMVKVDSLEEEMELLFAHQSSTLTEIIRILNHESVNLIAEHLVKQIAFESTGFGSLEKGLDIIKDHWKANGVNTKGMFLEDGSGLSHFNSVTTEQFSEALNYMYLSSPESGIFIESLANAGKGTLYVFSEKDFPENTLHCKSGSMTRVRCYAGYIETDSGKNLSFVFMVNNFEGKHLEVIKGIEKLLLSLKKQY